MGSEIKRYKPTWRQRWSYILERFLDTIFFTKIARKPRGPWCSKCGAVWPDITGLHRCGKCGLVDEKAKARWEEHLRLQETKRAQAYRQPGKQRSKRKRSSFDKLIDDIPFEALGAMGPMGFLGVGAVLLAAMERSKPRWWEAFDLERAPDTKELAKVAYRDALKRAHPDQGGSLERFHKVRKAWTKAERYYARREVSQAENQV